MAKFAGNIGFASITPANAGVHVEVITEYPYYGDVIRDLRRLERGQGLNDNIQLTNMISVVADAFAMQNYFAIRYVEWMGVKWRTTTAEVIGPRLILTLGVVYNG